MKKLLFLVVVLLFSCFCNSAFAVEKTLKFSWDAYTGEEATIIDGGSVLIYQRDFPSGTYDYTSPVKDVPQSLDAEGKSVPLTAEIIVDVPKGATVNWAFVARGNNDVGASLDSQEAVVLVDMTPLDTIDDLVAVYNKTTKTIDFGWTQNDVTRVTQWKLYKSAALGGPWTEVDTIEWDGEATVLTSSQSIVPAPGTREVYYFTVVAFNSDLNSANSNEVQITVDRRPATKVINLKVTVE